MLHVHACACLCLHVCMLEPLCMYVFICAYVLEMNVRMNASKQSVVGIACAGK